jgi:multidrug efflux pump
MVISGIVALTLSPAMAARILKPGHGQKRGFFRWFENAFASLTNGYVAGVRLLIRFRVLGVLLFAGVICGILVLFKAVPGSFVPQEDQGYIFVATIMPDAANLERTTQASDKAVKILRNHPAMGDVAQIDGYSIIDGSVKESAGLLFAALKPMADRPGDSGSTFSVIRETGQSLAGIRDGLIFPINPPSIPGLGSTGGFDFYIQSRSGGSAQDLEQVTKTFLAAARKMPELAGVSPPRSRHLSDNWRSMSIELATN